MVCTLCAESGSGAGSPFGPFSRGGYACRGDHPRLPESTPRVAESSREYPLSRGGYAVRYGEIGEIGEIWARPLLKRRDAPPPSPPLPLPLPAPPPSHSPAPSPSPPLGRPFSRGVTPSSAVAHRSQRNQRLARAASTAAERECVPPHPRERSSVGVGWGEGVGEVGWWWWCVWGGGGGGVAAAGVRLEEAWVREHRRLRRRCVRDGRDESGALVGARLGREMSRKCRGRVAGGRRGGRVGGFGRIPGPPLEASRVVTSAGDAYSAAFIAASV